MTDWWAAARERELKRLTRLWRDGDIADARYFMAIKGIHHPDWVPVRPLPRLPPLWRIVQHWAGRDVFRVDLAWPHCFGCQARVPGLREYAEGARRWNAAGRRLERGHLVNRARDGVDGAQNLVPLCHYCNRIMPIFDGPRSPEPGPVEWVRAGGWLQAFEVREDGALHRIHPRATA